MMYSMSTKSKSSKSSKSYKSSDKSSISHDSSISDDSSLGYGEKIIKKRLHDLENRIGIIESKVSNTGIQLENYDLKHIYPKKDIQYMSNPMGKNIKVGGKSRRLRKSKSRKSRRNNLNNPL